MTTIRKFLYPALALFCAVFAAFIFINGKNKNTFPSLKERQGALAQAPEWAETSAAYQKLTAELEAKPGDVKNTLLLAKVFMNEGRATGDFSYYNKAALTLIEPVLQKDPKNFEAICLKSMVYLSQHRFSEGKAIAEQALAANPYNSFVYGLLVDANVETGNYEQAVKMCDRMVAIRPDIRSYSRISYLRELHGDVAGAIEAIQQAVASGVPGHEDTEWARMVLAHLYEDSNQPEKALQCFQESLQYRPDYPFALAGLARIDRYHKDYPSAIQHLEKAAQVVNDASFYGELAELYRLGGQQEKADQTLRITLAALLADDMSGKKADKAGHIADFEIARLYLQSGKYADALKYAKAEYERRPANEDACELYAWTLHLNGMTSEAAQIIPAALRTGQMKPERLVMAGIIQAAAGNQAGKSLISKGLELKPYMNEELQAKARQTLAL